MKLLNLIKKDSISSSLALKFYIAAEGNDTLRGEIRNYVNDKIQKALDLYDQQDGA